MRNNLLENLQCRLLQGPGAIALLGQELDAESKVLLISTPNMCRRSCWSSLTETLGTRAFSTITVDSNPEIDDVDCLLEKMRLQRIDFIVALGGGSVLDVAKVLSVMLHHANNSLTLDEVLRNGTAFVSSRISLVCVPTTSGTGAEVTPFATIWDRKNMKKRSFAATTLIPDTVILDPELTFGTPIGLTVNFALDTCSHAMETLWNRNATSQSIEYANNALDLFVKNFPLVLKADSILVRENLQIASFIAGMAIAISRTAIAHSMSYPITLHYGVPHGLSCSFSLPKIAEMVTQKDAWVNGADKELIRQVIAILEGLDLDLKINSYCSREQRFALVGEMMTKGRADNFVLSDFSVLDLL